MCVQLHKPLCLILISLLGSLRTANGCFVTNKRGRRCWLAVGFLSSFSAHCVTMDAQCAPLASLYTHSRRAGSLWEKFTACKSRSCKPRNAIACSLLHLSALSIMFAMAPLVLCPAFLYPASSEPYEGAACSAKHEIDRLFHAIEWTF